VAQTGNVIPPVGGREFLSARGCCVVRVCGGIEGGQKGLGRYTLIPAQPHWPQRWPEWQPQKVTLHSCL